MQEETESDFIIDCYITSKMKLLRGLRAVRGEIEELRRKLEKR